MKNAFEAAFAKARAATGARPEPADDIDADSTTAANDGDDNDDTSDSGDGDNDDSEESGDSDDAGGEGGDDEQVSIDELKQLLEAGKVRALAKKLGVDPKTLDVHPAKLRRMGKAKEELSQVEQRVKDLKHEAARIQAENVTKQAELSARGARIEAIERAVKDQRWTEVASGIEQLLPAGMTYAKLTQLVAQGSGASPSKGSVDPEIRRELEELKRKLAEREERDQKLTREQQAQRDREHVRTTLAKHELAKIDGFEDAVIAEMHKHWDPATKGFRKSLKQVADEIVRRERAKAEKLLGLKRPKQKQEKREQARDDDGRFVVPAGNSESDKDQAFRLAYASALRKSRGAR